MVLYTTGIDPNIRSRNTVRILGCLTCVRSLYVFGYMVFMVFTCFMSFFVKHPYTSGFEQRENITLLFIKANDSPFELFLQSFVWQGRCSTRKNNSCLCENLRDDPSTMTTNEKHTHTHTHQNHCQQKTFNLIFKKKLKKPTQKAYSKTYLEVDTIDV